MNASLGLMLGAAVVSADGTLIDRVAIAVDKQVVTETELLAEARVALAYREGGDVASRPLERELLDGFRDYLIDQLLIGAQALRSGDIEISESLVTSREQSFRQRFTSEAAYRAFMRRFGISRAALLRILRRDARNARFIDLQMRAKLSAMGGAKGSAKYNEALARWVDDLRSAAEIRVAGDDGQMEIYNRAAARRP